MKEEYYYNIVFTLLGVVVFSSVCSTISQDYLHMPFTVPELLIIPFVFLLRKKVKTIRLNYILFFKLLACSFLLIGIAMLWNVFDIGSIISCARNYIYLILFLCMFDRPNDVTQNDLLYLSLGSLIGWAYTSYGNLAQLMYIRSDEFITYGLFLGVPIFLTLSIQNKKYMTLALGFIFLIVIFMFAGIRRVVAVFLISLILLYVLKLIGNPRNLIKILLGVLLFVGVFYMILPWMESTVKDLSPYLYYRMFERTSGFASNDLDNSDVTRISNLTLIMDTEVDLLLPHGFNTTRYDIVKGSGVFNDVPLFSLAWIIGLPLTFVLLIYFGIRTIKLYKIFRKTTDTDCLNFLLCSIVMYAMLFFDGTFLTYVYAAPITGLCLGKIKMLSKNHYIVSSK